MVNEDDSQDNVKGFGRRNHGLSSSVRSQSEYIESVNEKRKIRKEQTGIIF